MADIFIKIAQKALFNRYHGPELISATLTDWCETNDIELVYIQLGKPQQNGFVVRFNGSFRIEFFDAYLFENLNQVREMA